MSFKNIGRDNVYIIAEMSANHSGKLENALQIVREAKKAGADCVKIQTYTADTITIPCDEPEFKIHGGLWDGYTYYDLYKEAYTPWEWQEEIKKECENVGVDFLSTPFDFSAVDFLEKLDVEAYKIASYELVDIPLIEYVASKGKPVIISCGMGTKDEVEDAVKACRRQNNNQIILLKCCSEYPAKAEDMNLSMISVLKEKYDVRVGLSDHTPGYEVPALAVAAGARVIEKHVMLDCAEDNPDKGFSMPMSDFRKMVEKVRETEKIMGCGDFQISESEQKDRTMRRSLYAVADIKKGETFSPDNIRSIRPGYGVSPKYYHEILGQTAKEDIAYGEAIKENMFEHKKSLEFIPYSHQCINENDLNAVKNALRADYLTTGPKITEFEDVVKKYVGAKYAVACANGTAALHATMFAADIKPGDEVITTPITFAASSNCALYMGATPVFADINPKTYNIDSADVERKITNRTKAIVAVDFTGQPCELDELREIAQKHNLVLVEDGAHSLGAEYKGRKVGTLADMTTFSFHPVKHITTGEGGMIVTNDEGFYIKLRRFVTHGITRDESELLHHDGPWYYEQQFLGYNYRITDFQCALGISQMNRLDWFLDRRREIAKRYDAAFDTCNSIIIPYQMQNVNNSYHLYVVWVKNRKEVFSKMREAGIGVNVHYIPVYHHPYYRQNGYEDIFLENAEHFYQGCISLPVYPDLKDEQQNYVIETLMKLVE